MQYTGMYKTCMRLVTEHLGYKVTNIMDSYSQQSQFPKQVANEVMKAERCMTVGSQNGENGNGNQAYGSKCYKLKTKISFIDVTTA